MNLFNNQKLQSLVADHCLQSPDLNVDSGAIVGEEIKY